MSSVNVTKSVLSSPNQIETEATESNPPSSALNDVALTYMKYEHKIEQSLRLSQKEAHQKRMQSMRKELDYLNGTAWQFENADKGF